MSSRGQATSGQENAPFSKRTVKKAPSPKQDELKEWRRDIFLKKVKQGREDKRFETRGEDVRYKSNLAAKMTGCILT